MIERRSLRCQSHLRYEVQQSKPDCPNCPTIDLMGTSQSLGAIAAIGAIRAIAGAMSPESHEGKVHWCEWYGMDQTSAGGGISWLDCEFVLGWGWGSQWARASKYPYKQTFIARLAGLPVVPQGHAAHILILISRPACGAGRLLARDRYRVQGLFFTFIDAMVAVQQQSLDECLFRRVAYWPMLCSCSCIRESQWSMGQKLFSTPDFARTGSGLMTHAPSRLVGNLDLRLNPN